MNNYIADLRQLVGQRPLLMVGAAVLVFNSAGHVLLLKRNDNACWGLPGGALELGESLEDCARRELREETALEAGQLSFYQVFSGPAMFYRYPHGDEVHNVTAVYLHRCDDTPQADGEECSVCRFWPPAALPDELSPPDRVVLERWTNFSQLPA